MAEKALSDFIKHYWDDQGKKHGSSHWASWGDHWMIELEIDTISSCLQAGQDVLDIGCANGYSTFRQFQGRHLNSMTGVDFSEAMIHAACARKDELELDDRIGFVKGDVRSLEFDSGRFDVAYTTRVLINLPSWEEQVQGIEECLRVVCPGGTVILSEAFWEPLVLLNALRLLKQLPPLVEHDFNRYLKSERLELYLAERGLSFKKIDFSSLYYLGSRFLREIVTIPNEYPGYSNPINQAFYELEKRYSGGGFGIQQAYVIYKPR